MCGYTSNAARGKRLQGRSLFWTILIDNGIELSIVDYLFVCCCSHDVFNVFDVQLEQNYNPPLCSHNQSSVFWDPIFGTKVLLKIRPRCNTAQWLDHLSSPHTSALSQKRATLHFRLGEPVNSVGLYIYTSGHRNEWTTIVETWFMLVIIMH